MIFFVESLPDFLCGEVALFYLWRGWVILCVERLRDFLCRGVA